ncbi:MAG: hypothetical protein HYT49_03585 [Candidatus Wildermuthbacteria bacterium]|nr:hypothetical protein [Candidatus Wildermuthbacteria bacterium]
MNTKILISISFLAAFFLTVGAYRVFAQEDLDRDVAFPVAELGNCGSKEECKSYCDNVENIAACVGFAERHGLMSGEELQEAKQVVQALSQGAKLPGGCRSKLECDAYCQVGSNIEECIAFAEAAGFLTGEELQEAKRIAPLMARGEMPGDCRSKEQCEAYCSDENNTEECVAFFEKAGFMTAEEVQMFRKTGGKGPGGCRGREECDSFCNDPANQTACFEFAKEHDLISAEELQNMEEGMTKFREGFQNAPPEVAQCLKDTIGEDVLEKIEAGTFLPNQELGEHMRGCFEQFMPAMPAGEGFGPEGEQGMMRPEASGCIQGILGDMSQMQGPPTAEQEQRIREECFPQQQGGPASQQGGFEGTMPPEFQGEFQNQFEQQFQEQFQEEYQRQLEQQSPEGFMPPEGYQMPEGYQPPEQYQVPQEFQVEQTAPMEQMAPQEPAPAPEPTPESSLQKKSFLGAVVEAMRPGLKILFPFLPI